MGKEITHDEQLERWVEGESIHIGTKEEGCCCPDFSCCNENMRTPREERERFVAAGEDERLQMLGTFLGRAIAQHRPEGDVYIAGRDDEEASR